MKTTMQSQPIVSLKNATMSFDSQVLWSDLGMEVHPGEFLAVLGPNGVGKSSLLKVLLGTIPLSKGTVEVNGTKARRGNPVIGYIPQQKTFDPGLPIRGRDLVEMGLTGKLWGMPYASKNAGKDIDRVITAVGAKKYALKPIGTLSGGEQQRLRIAQALVTTPRLLLCDEPLLSLDLASQHQVSMLIDTERRKGAAIIFVTHDINPILSFVDRVLYIVGGKWRIGTPSEVLTSATLSELYGVPVEVLRVHGRLLVVSESLPAEALESHHHVGEVL